MKEVMILNRRLGFRREDGVFIKYVNREEHYFRMFDGWGLNSALLNSLHKQKCPKIILIIKEEDGTQKKIWTTPEIWLNNGDYYLNKQEVKGNIIPEPQMVLHEGLFKE